MVLLGCFAIPTFCSNCGQTPIYMCIFLFPFTQVKGEEKNIYIYISTLLE